MGGNSAFRSNPDGTLTRVTVVPGAGSFLGTATVGPDGALDVAVGASVIVRLGLDGTRTVRRYKAPGNTDNYFVDELAAAQDSTLWLGWFGCSYVLRLAPDDTISSVPALDGASVDQLAIGTDGTVWGKALPLEPRLFKITPAGRSSTSARHRPQVATSQPRLMAPRGSTTPRAARCSTWQARPRRVCARRSRLSRPRSGLTGPLWLADRTQLLHLSAAELTSVVPCDTTDPELSVPGAAHAKVTLRALRRARGLRVRSSEAGTVSGFIRLAGTKRKLGVVDARSGRTASS